MDVKLLEWILTVEECSCRRLFDLAPQNRPEVWEFGSGRVLDYENLFGLSPWADARSTTGS